jgi:plastocyanin
MNGLVRRRFCGAGLALLAAAFVSRASAGVPDNATVTIDNFTFKPDVLTIRAGSTVTFVNHDDIPHSIVEAGGKFKSKVLDTDESFRMTFDGSGNITYFCGLHPHMTGKIIVMP